MTCAENINSLIKYVTEYEALQIHYTYISRHAKNFEQMKILGDLFETDMNLKLMQELVLHQELILFTKKQIKDLTRAVYQPSKKRDTFFLLCDEHESYFLQETTTKQ